MDASRPLELRKNTRYPQGLLRMKVGYALVLHHSGVIYIASFRSCDWFILCNISALHTSNAEGLIVEEWPIVQECRPGNRCHVCGRKVYSRSQWFRTESKRREQTIRLGSEQERFNICPISPNRHPWKSGYRSE